MNTLALTEHKIIYANVTPLHTPLLALAVDARDQAGYRMLSTQLAKTHANDVWPDGLSGNLIVLPRLQFLRARTSDADPIHPP